MVHRGARDGWRETRSGGACAKKMGATRRVSIGSARLARGATPTTTRWRSAVEGVFMRRARVARVAC